MHEIYDLIWNMTLKIKPEQVCKNLQIIHHTLRNKNLRDVCATCNVITEKIIATKNLFNV